MGANSTAQRPRTKVWAACAGMLAWATLAGGGCQADFAADILNKTPQPLFAQIMTKSNDGKSASLGASRRLGPGDRAMVGPVRTNEKAGAYLVLDTMPNPTRPVTWDMPPGASFLVVTQDPPTNDGVLRIELKR